MIQMEALAVIQVNDLTAIVKQAVREALAAKSTPEPKEEQPDLGGIDLACEVTGLCKSTIYKLKMDGKLPVKKQGKKLYFSRKELTAWIEAGNIKTATELETEAVAHLATVARKKLR